MSDNEFGAEAHLNEAPSRKGVRVTLLMDERVCLAIEELKIRLGARSRGELINQLLRDLLLSKEVDSEECLGFSQEEKLEMTTDGEETKLGSK